MKMIRESEEVYRGADTVLQVSSRDISFLKARALETQRRRVRLCAHESMDARVHEMLIVHTRSAYIPPHRHLNNTEAFHVIEGQFEVVLFEDNGDIKQVIAMGEKQTGRLFYYRLNACLYHCLIPISEQVVFHEITAGPFDRHNTQFAPFAPGEDADPQEIIRFQNRLHQALDALRPRTSGSMPTS